MFSTMADDIQFYKLYNDNPSFRKWLTDAIFGITYNEGDSKPPELR